MVVTDHANIDTLWRWASLLLNSKDSALPQYLYLRRQVEREDKAQQFVNNCTENVRIAKIEGLVKWAGKFIIPKTEPRTGHKNLVGKQFHVSILSRRQLRSIAILTLHFSCWTT